MTYGAVGRSSFLLRIGSDMAKFSESMDLYGSEILELAGAKLGGLHRLIFNGKYLSQVPSVTNR